MRRFRPFSQALHGGPALKKAPPEIRFIVRGFDERGKCLVETMHTDDASAGMAISILAARVEDREDPTARYELTRLPPRNRSPSR